MRIRHCSRIWNSIVAIRRLRDNIRRQMRVSCKKKKEKKNTLSQLENLHKTNIYTHSKISYSRTKIFNNQRRHDDLCLFASISFSKYYERRLYVQTLANLQYWYQTNVHSVSISNDIHIYTN